MKAWKGSRGLKKMGGLINGHYHNRINFDVGKKNEIYHHTS